MTVLATPSATIIVDINKCATNSLCDQVCIYYRGDQEVEIPPS